MSGCNGKCGCCPGCGRALELTEQEIALLRTFSQLPFQPVGKTGEGGPRLFPGGTEQTALALMLLEKKGLLSLDYESPLTGYSEAAYDSLPLRGSAALTARGQQVLDLLEYQGITE